MTSGAVKNRTQTAALAVLVALCLVVPALAIEVWNVYPQHDKLWTGRVMNAQSGFKKLGPEVMFGKSSDPKDPPDSKWQGWFKFDLSGIPENATIVSASLFYNAISPGNGTIPWSYVTVIANDPVTAEPQQLWQDITGGTIAAPALKSEKEWVERPLNPAGIAAVQSGLTLDWVAFGLYKYDNTDTTGKGHVKGYNTGKFRPYLKVTFAAADMGIVSILAPVGDIAAGTAVEPKVLVQNEGDLDVPFSVEVAITNGATEYYRQSVDVPGLPVGEAIEVVFPDWLAGGLGGEPTVSATITLANDADPTDNHVVSWFSVVAASNGEPPPQPPEPPEPPEPPLPPRPTPPGPPRPVFWGWREVRSIPTGPLWRQVRSGSWLAVDRRTGIIYAGKGNKTSEFYAYEPSRGRWTPLPSIPGEPPGKGARAAADGNGSVFLVKAGGTQEFWCYSITQGQWVQLPDVPLGARKKKVKAGTSIAHMSQYGLDYVYLLKGTVGEFMRYTVQSQEWESLAPGPVGGEDKWPDGSWLANDGSGRLQMHRGKVHELWSFDPYGDAWGQMVPGMPYLGYSLKSKACKSGACATAKEGDLYALKGGNTQEFWMYRSATENWVELDPLPILGTTLKKKKAGQGADIVAYPFGRALYAFKGNKTYEFWRYTMAPIAMLGGAAGRARAGSPATFIPNPVTSGVLRYPVPAPGRVVVSAYDVSGRLALRRVVTADGSGRVSLPVGDLAAGSYMVRVEGVSFNLGSKLVVGR